MVDKAEREKIFKEVTEKILKKHQLQSPYDIDNGHCEEWAKEVCKRIPCAEILDTPPEYQGPGHFWVLIQGLNFDAETTQGVKDWHNLKIFRKD